MTVRFDPERVRANVQQATTEDLLDRLTVYRNGMEQAALEMIEAELNGRGIAPDQVEAHARLRREHVFLDDEGTALSCSFCDRPAVDQGWGWHQLWGLLPVFPRYFFYCEKHRPAPKAGQVAPPFGSGERRQP